MAFLSVLMLVWETNIIRIPERLYFGCGSAALWLKLLVSLSVSRRMSVAVELWLKIQMS